MRIHYVEDDKADVLALRHVLRDRRDLTIHSSERMDQIGAAPGLASLDALLIDVRRPDSVSIEDDVRSARSFTGAPLIFLTGLDPAPLRHRALQAGAHGVLSKHSLDADLLTECLERAKCARPSRPSRDPELAPPEPEPLWPMVNPTVASVKTAAVVLEHGLSALGLTKGDAQTSLTELDDLGRLAHMLRLIGSRSFSATTSCEASSPLKRLGSLMAERVAHSQVALMIECEDGVQWDALGSKQDALAGLEALVRAAFCACAPRDWLHINLCRMDDQARIDIVSNQARIADLARVFGGADGAEGRDRAFMECAVHLLGLRAEQLRTSLHPFPTLTIYL